jgi:hypothetical protein
MNRRLSLCFVCCSIFCIALSAQVNAPGQPTDARVADLIAQVKNMPASKLDAALPSTKLEEWLQAQAGPDAKIGWAFRSVPQDAKAGAHGAPACVEAVATLNDGRSFWVLIDVSTNPDHPRLFDANVLTGKTEMSEVRRLHDLPRVLRQTSHDPDHSEAQR